MYNNCEYIILQQDIKMSKRQHIYLDKSRVGYGSVFGFEFTIVLDLENSVAIDIPGYSNNKDLLKILDKKRVKVTYISSTKNDDKTRNVGFRLNITETIRDYKLKLLKLK